MLNKVFLIGRLGADPEIRYTPNGQPVVSFRVATTETWRDRSGSRKERTEWHSVVTFGSLAEICGDYLNKGRLVFVEGSLRTRSWEDRDGNRRYTTEIVAQTVKFLGPGKGQEDAQDPQEPEDEPPPSDDEIPF